MCVFELRSAYRGARLLQCATLAHQLRLDLGDTLLGRLDGRTRRTRVRRRRRHLLPPRRHLRRTLPQLAREAAQTVRRKVCVTDATTAALGATLGAALIGALAGRPHFAAHGDHAAAMASRLQRRAHHLQRRARRRELGCAPCVGRKQLISLRAQRVALRSRRRRLAAHATQLALTCHRLHADGPFEQLGGLGVARGLRLTTALGNLESVLAQEARLALVRQLHPHPLQLSAQPHHARLVDVRYLLRTPQPRLELIDRPLAVGELIAEHCLLVRGAVTHRLELRLDAFELSPTRRVLLHARKHTGGSTRARARTMCA